MPWSDNARRRWLVTGCSTGIGRALAEVLLAAGHSVVVTSRTTTSIEVFRELYPQQALVLALDVIDPEAAPAAAAAAQERFGGLDVLINNAGYAFLGAIEETEPEEYRSLFETNLFGAIAAIRAVLPMMRRQGGGRIVNIGSTAAANPGAGMGYYAATKAALTAVGEAVAKEAAPYGVRVTTLELGGHRTEAIRRMAGPRTILAEYAETVGKMRAGMANRAGNEPGDPHLAAMAIISIVGSADPPLHVALGVEALARLRARAARIIEEADAWESMAVSSVRDASPGIRLERS